MNFPLSYLLLLGGSLAVSLAILPPIIQAAIRSGWVDQPSARKVHQRVIPRCGGVGMFLAFFPFVLLGVFLPPAYGGIHPSLQMIHFMIAVAIIFLLGLADDVYDLRPRWKFLVQFLLAGWMVAAGFRMPSLLFDWIQDPMILAVISVFWIVGVTNAVNLIDGLDGLAGGIALLVLVTLTMLATGKSHAEDIHLFTLPLIGAVGGFLFYNSNPARVFMGDSGSLVLGFILAVLSIRNHSLTTTAAGVLVPLVALGIPIFDTIFAMTRRVLVGRKPFSADREHLHHKLLDLGLNQRQVVMIIYALTAILCLVALGLAMASDKVIGALIVLYPLVMYVLVKRLGYIPRIARAQSRNARMQKLRRYRTAFQTSNWLSRAYLRLVESTPFQASLDLAALLASWGLALWITHPATRGFDLEADSWEHLRPIATHIGLWVLSTIVFKCYEPLWRYVEFNASFRHLKAVGFSTVMTWLLAPVLFDSHLNARLLFVLGGTFLVFAMGIRLSQNIYYGYLKRLAAETKQGARVAIFGAGDSGEGCLHFLLRNDDIDYIVVGFIDDDPLKVGKSIYGRPVLGALEHLREVHKRTPFDLLVLSTFPRFRERRLSLKRMAASLGVNVVVFQPDFVKRDDESDPLDFDSQLPTPVDEMEDQLA